jgi:hypothetical protein
MAKLKHTALDTTTRRIRLPWLHRAEDFDAPLVAELKIYDLAREPLYQAISNQWRHEDPDNLVTINGGEH